MSGMSLNPLLEQGRARERALSEAERQHFGGDWTHLPKDKRPSEATLKRAAAISPHAGHPQMIQKDRMAFGHVLAGRTDDRSIHGAHAHAIRTGQVDALSKALKRSGKKVPKLSEAANAATEEADSKKGPVVHQSTVFDDTNPADSYPQGTEINFGETAPMDMSGIPDLFDPAAVTGDGI